MMVKLVDGLVYAAYRYPCAIHVMMVQYLTYLPTLFLLSAEYYFSGRRQEAYCPPLAIQVQLQVERIMQLLSAQLFALSLPVAFFYDLLRPFGNGNNGICSTHHKVICVQAGGSTSPLSTQVTQLHRMSCRGSCANEPAR
jgi:hypothetical protein